MPSSSSSFFANAFDVSISAAERALGMSYRRAWLLVEEINQALRAHTLFTRDKDYIVRDGEVVIIDEFTGRMMPGRRYSEGLHQALEAKEHQPVQPENQTLASITFALRAVRSIPTPPKRSSTINPAAAIVA